MNPELIFKLCSIGVLPVWLLLVLAPRWQWTDRIVHRIWIPGLLAAAYGFLLLTRPPMPQGAGFGSLPAVMILLGSTYGALIGWIHFLAFDLFIGAWQVRDARRLAIHHGWVVPGLLGTFMYGPVGLLWYFAVRFVACRTVSLQEQPVRQS
jgi:Domain of unknown function (DUF4281)